MNPRAISPITGMEKRFRAISYTLVFLMMSCVVLTISILIHNVSVGWHPGIIAGLLFFIILDRLYTYRQLKSLTPGTSEWLIAFGVHWVVILFFGRFLLSYANGLDSLRADLMLIGRGYFLDLFTLEFIMTLILAFVVWELTKQFLELLDEIGLDMSLAWNEERPPLPSDAVPAHQRLVGLIFSVGIALVILAALTRINLQAIVSNSTGAPSLELIRFSGAEAGALLYFVFGLALLSVSRLMSLQTHWNRMHIPISSANLPRQWAMYSLIFLILLAVLVSLLPAGDSLGFFALISTLISFLFQVFAFIAQVILGLILLLFSLPFLLLGTPPPTLLNSAPPPIPTLPTQPVLPTTNNALWELIKSILLWGSLLAILVFALIYFVRQHDSLLTSLRKGRVLNWLVLAWQWLYRATNQTRLSLVRAIEEGWQSLVARLDRNQVLPRSGWISVRALDPRRRIYFFYLAMIRRGAEQGVPRQPSQTPAEYAATLEEALPAVHEDIASMTEAFIEARYSRRAVDANKANRVKATWDRIRRALQRKDKNARSRNP